MDITDRLICETVQRDGRASSAAIAEAAGIPTSTANDRLRRLSATGAIKGWHATLDAKRVGAGLACFVLIDMQHEGEDEAVETLCDRPEVQEMHHISGAHSYLVKLRLKDMDAMQSFLAEVVKPLRAVQRTETTFALKTHKETAQVHVAHPSGGEEND
ncbi:MULTISPECIES: Lrp/AsnC family transcriptional regulator [unclassified Pseudophaeobacter]|uniref:Lrp/AsnC family transcriptional regulator n=1 Tax=unclassified Pseudophaeobacter TaxID=2637024 RepID=UPI000EFD055E|nr:Lrp/AsnC family transcriptional regulator [Pseudophaeobacter sp. EL27]